MRLKHSIAVAIKKSLTRLKYLLDTSSSLRYELLRSICGVAGARFINLVLAFITTILLARNLGPEDYGAYAFIISLANSLALFSYLGLPALMVREIAKYEQSQRWGLIRGLLQKSNQLVTCIGGLLMLVMAIVSINFATTTELDRWRLLLIALPLILAIGHINLATATLRGLRKFILGSIPEMVVRPAIFLLVLLLLIFVEKATAQAVIVTQVGAAMVALAVGFLFVQRITSGKIRSATIEYNNKDWISALIPFAGLAGVSFLNVEFINVFLGFSGTNQDVALFRSVANLALIVVLPLSLIESVISPYITRLYHAGELGKLQKLTQAASLSASLAAAVPAIVLVFFGTETITYFYGSEYASANSTLVVIVLGYMIVNLVGLSMQLLYATEYHASAFRISAYGAVATVLLCSFLIPLFGALGAGVVLGFGRALRAIFFVIEARRRLAIKTSLIW